MGSTVDDHELADPKLLEKIDQLFELNIGEYVDLPQLLVVGDQSSGKSSVLEGLTGLPFPRDSGLCTRFATQITFRRALETKTTVSIIPAADAKVQHAEKLRSWRKDSLKSLDSETFVQVLKEVYELMGLGNTANSVSQKTFSDDVLRIEICGPKQQHLSVIDVPGIFKRTTVGVTTKEDIGLVRKMVLSYMKNARSIILAVVPANVDIATQEILEMAEECDQNGERTLGVLTKPDLVDKGAEHNVMKIVEGKDHILTLGWCIVKNPGQKELLNTTTDRNSIERTFFKTQEPWARLPKDRVGNEALRVRLVEILSEMIQRVFVKVKLEISQKLRATHIRLESLGPSRETKGQQYKYLLDLATKFQGVTSLALKSDYGSDDIFDGSDDFKLVTAFVNRNAVFSDDVAKKGHTVYFKDEAPAVEENEEIDDERQPGQPKLSMVTPTRRHQRNFDELDDVLHQEDHISNPSQSPITAWLEEIYNASRGFELGTFDPSLLAIAWKKQSAKWDPLGFGYISDIVSLVHTFIVKLLSALCKDERSRRELHSVLLDKLIERYKRSTDHTKFILSVERAGTPLTTNHYFAENLEKSRQQRLRSQLNKAAIFSDTLNTRVVRVDTTIPTTTASNAEHTISDLHDILKSYYKVARKRFVDIVCMQAADHHLITGPDTPLKVFCPTFVNELTPEQLDTVAGEEASTRRKRKQLKRDIENLEKGKKVLM